MTAEIALAPTIPAPRDATPPPAPTDPPPSSLDDLALPFRSRPARKPRSYDDFARALIGEELALAASEGLR